MIREVRYSSKFEKQMAKGRIPHTILKKLYAWVFGVQLKGLAEVRKTPGYHDEPCQGQMFGYRSIRLTIGWRAYYRIEKEEVQFVLIERVDHHEY